MKSLSEIIDQCGDAEAEAQEYCKDSPPGTGFPTSFYCAGHRACFDKLGPALKHAINALDRADYAGDMGAQFAKTNIRAILEAK